MPKAKSKSNKSGKDTKKEAKSKEEMPKDQPTSAEETAEETSTSTKTKDELWDECLQLQQELDKVRTEERHLQMERDLAQRSWDKCKRELEETRAGIREGLRVKQEMKRRHQEEIREWEQKLKTTQTAHLQEIAELKMTDFATKSQLTAEHVASEDQLLEKTHSLQADEREKQAVGKILISEIQKKHCNELEELNHSYEKKAREMETCCEKKMQLMTEVSIKKTQTELDEINTSNMYRAASIIEEMEETLTVTKEVFDKRQEIQADNKRLQRELERAKQIDKKMTEALQDRQKLMERLRRLRERRQQLPDKWRKDLSGLILDKELDLFVKHLDLKEAQRQLDHIRVEIDEFLEVFENRSQRGPWLEMEIQASIARNEEESFKVWLAFAFGKADKIAARKIERLIASRCSSLKGLKQDVCQYLKEYDELVKKAAAVGKPPCSRLPRSDVEKSIRNISNKNMAKMIKMFEDIIKNDENSSVPADEDSDQQPSEASE